jgi:hypothetical protein
MPFDPYFHRWCQAADHPVGPHRLRVLTERPGARAGIAADLDASVLDNYDDLQRLERWATQLGLPNAAAVLRDTLPITARARSGHIGEMLLSKSRATSSEQANFSKSKFSITSSLVIRAIHRSAPWAIFPLSRSRLLKKPKAGVCRTRQTVYF